MAQPHYTSRPVVITKLAPFTDYLHKRIADAALIHLSAVVLLREIKEQGYEGSLSLLRQYLFKHRASAATKLIERFETAPGKQMQVDWGQIVALRFCGSLGF